MGRLSNIMDKMDAKCFEEDYYNMRPKSLSLVSFDGESNDLLIKIVPLVPYEKINDLIMYIENRDYAHRGPLRGIDLRFNGFSEVVDTFEMPVQRYRFEQCMQFKNEEIINAQALIHKLTQIESYHALLPHADKKYEWIYILNNLWRDREFDEYCKSAKIYSEFLKLADKMESTNPYVKLEFDEYRDSSIFFPAAYITFDRRPYLIFQQKNAGTRYNHQRSIPQYKLDEFLELYDNPREASGKQYPSVAYVFDHVFAFPADKEEKSKRIIDIYYSIFAESLDAKDIYYDWVKKCYCFNPDIEERIFANYKINQANDVPFCKYTSLKTLMNILNSGTMRLNSISTMNDPTETQKLYSEGCNFIYENEDSNESIKFANNYYLTSFSSSKDDLNMWRFYGDNAQGVCMVFEPLIEEHQVFDVNYDDLESESLMKIEAFLLTLNKEEIRFCLESYVDKYLFIKPKEFETENECRLVIATIDKPEFTVYPNNNIVTPYIERKLTYNSKEVNPSCKEIFPLKLTRIILGPEMKNKDINKLQLEHMIFNKPLFCGNVEVEPSTINCYRQ